MNMRLPKSAFQKPQTPQATVVQYRLAAAQEKPWEHSFTSLLRYLAARHRDKPPLGHAKRPGQEPFRLGQQPTLAFAPREIAHVDTTSAHPKINLFSLGMLGANGPLPIHFTEIVKDRSDNRRDATLVNFLNIFHHRAMTHQYRAWAQSQSAASLDRSDEEGFTRYISRLMGDDPADISHSPLPTHARIAACAHLTREARNPDGLCATLTHYFGVPVTIQEHLLHWIDVAPEEHTLLGMGSESSRLGIGALAGEKVPDRQHKFRLVIGPLKLAPYLRFTPTTGSHLPILVEWVRAFIGYEYVWDVELKMHSADVPLTRLGGEERLGWSTWLGNGNAVEAMTGMIFEPEQHGM